MSAESSSTSRIGFLVLNEFSMIAFSSAIEVLRMANYVSGKTLYSWTVFSVDGQPVSSSNGLPTAPLVKYGECDRPDLVFVCGGTNVTRFVDDRVIALLRRIDQDKVNLGGLCTGTYALVKSGLLDGYKATIHWENISGLRECYARVNFVDDLFVIDRNRLTCTGGIAPIDLMLTLIGDRYGKTLVAQICDQFILGRARDGKDRQHIPLAARMTRNHKTLAEVASLMEANIEEPLSLDELSQLAGLSQRHLQRMFRDALECTPKQYYLELRLRRARELLLQTGMSITSITVACGFQSLCYFSKAYRTLFGKSPRDERQHATKMPSAIRRRRAELVEIPVAIAASASTAISPTQPM